METGKPGLASAPVHIGSVTTQPEKRMDIQAPLTAVYIHTVPALPVQPYPQPPAAAQEPATLHLAMPPLYSKEMLPFLTLHIAGGLQSQSGLSLAAAAPVARPKSAGKHVCPHCQRDCMKPSVLEKHLRCHTGERPYPCTTCGVSFKTQSNLYKHRRTQAHARLSSESEQSSLGSLDSLSSSRETCTSSLSLDERSEESGSMEKDTPVHAAENTSPKVSSAMPQSSVCEQHELTLSESNEREKVTKEEEKQRTENERPNLTVSRHLPLQRQEATLFSKQSHESTDSGFSESSDHYPSPGSVLPDHSMDSLSESTREHVEGATSTNAPSETDHGGQEPKGTARQQEKKTLEERISKLISENTAVVEDKQLENVRPRKTVLSKQGSIDLPVPYTYKDSFHFDMKHSQNQNFGLHRGRKPGFYTSVPTQQSSTMEHAPLTRSNSLPFSVTLLQPERNSPTSFYQNDYVTLVRRGSSGQINPTGFAIKPVNQHSSAHRPLVRQTAVDCNHATDGLFMNSSVEEACTGSLSCDGDGSDICGEPSNRKFKRKKAQKFAYNKWYMYGGGTFKKLYNAEKSDDNSVTKGRKCSTNPEHEVVQSLQKRLSMVYKETITTTGLTANLTNSTATMGHPACPSGSLSLAGAVDFHSQTSEMNSSCNPLKAPLRRNLSLSVLPSIGSLVSPKSDCVNKTEAVRLITAEKHCDFTSHVCGTHIPSDRKKQKTDDKIICPLETEADRSTLRHPPPSITGSVLQQDTNLTYINLQQNQKQTQLKGVLFPSCLINANAPSVSTSQATSISTAAAKNSFLPKYQLKLPNAAGTDSNPSPQVVDKLTGADGCSVTSNLSSPHTDQTITSVTPCEKDCREPITPCSIPNCDLKEMNALSSTDECHTLPCTVTASCLDLASSPAVMHRQFAATTITTSCLQGYQTGLCSSLIESSKSATGSVSVQLTRPVAPMAANCTAPLTVTTASNQTSSAAVSTFSQDQSYPSSNPLLSHTQLSMSRLSNPENGARHIIPFDQVQPAAQNVFHVQTADLQICLQIISDEQLALIEPQIEHPTGISLSQRDPMEAEAPGVQNKAHSFVTMEGSSEGRVYEQPERQKEMAKSESMPPSNTDRMAPLRSVPLGQADLGLHQVKYSHPSLAAASAESVPPEIPALMLHPQKYGHVNMTIQTKSCVTDVVSTAASLSGVKSGRSQTSEEEKDLIVKRCAEQQLLLDGRVSQGGLISQTLSGQHQLSVSCLSPGANQNSMKSEQMDKGSQHKLTNQDSLGNEGTIKAKGEALGYKNNRTESEECLSQALGSTCADKLSGTVSSISTNRCKALRQLNTQASIYSSNLMEPTLCETLNSPKHLIMGCDAEGPSDKSTRSLEMTPCQLQDAMSSGHSVSSKVQTERPEDISTVQSRIQSPAAEPTEGTSLEGCPAQRGPQTWEHAETPGQTHSTACKPKQTQESGEANHQCTEEQTGGGVTGEDKNGGIKTDKFPGSSGKVESDCRATVLPNMTKPEGEDSKVRADSFQNSWLSEQHLPHLSQMHSGMSEYPPPSSRHAPSMSNNLNSPDSSIQTSPPQPPLELNHLYITQQNWESSIIPNQPTQFLCEFNSSQHLKSQAQLSRSKPGLQQTITFSQQDQKPTSTSVSILQGNTAADNNSAVVSCHSKVTLGSHTNPSLSPDDRALSPTHSSKVSQATALTGNMQTLKNNQNTGPPSKPCIYPDTVENHNTMDRDINKYQPIFLTGQVHGYHPAECMTAGVRPVQSCQDYMEDNSSSDDEGKLIIEL